MRIYNTLSKKLEDFKPIVENQVSLYTCGPTVYDFTHIGHIRAYVFNDILRRSLMYAGFNVKHVMNITDVGHLSDDADQGEDKMEKGATKYGKTVWEVAKYYTDFFFKSTDAMNILRPNIICRATDHISEMIEMIKTLLQNGHAYETKEAVYFDVTTFNTYGTLSGQLMKEKIKAARSDVYVDPDKKHPADFALWFKRVGKFKDHSMHWQSPWGNGFPGWHIECSAMSMKYLGKTIDIHTGGIDHIPLHHENEIAQSEGVTGVPFVHYWMHYHFLQVDGQKMSKSLNNFYTVDDIQKRGIDPMAFRLLLLQSHYRQPVNFTWDGLKASQEGYKSLKQQIVSLQNYVDIPSKAGIQSDMINDYEKRFRDFIFNDLQTPGGVAIMWQMLKSNINPEEKLKLISKFDRVLGLKLLESNEVQIPQEIIELAQKRKLAKGAKDFIAADNLRKQIEEKGYLIEDTQNDFKVKKN